MKFLDKLINNKTKFQRIFGLNFIWFTELIKIIEPIWDAAEKKRLSRPNRKRDIGGGHPYKFTSVAEMILVVLIYYKQYPTQELLGLMLEVDQSAISRLLKKMLPLIEEAADPEMKKFLSEAKANLDKNQRAGNLQELLEQYPDLRDVSIDTTEQPCYRAQNYDKQKEHYSGKTKQHAVKTQITVSITGRILDVSASYPGRDHDKKIIDQEKTVTKFHKKVPQRFDSGYQGGQKDHPEHYIILPVKKSKNKPLTVLDKEHNKCNSKRRVVVEHAFARIKSFKICNHLFRQPLQSHNKTFRNVVSILNFRMQNIATIM